MGEKGSFCLPSNKKVPAKSEPSIVDSPSDMGEVGGSPNRLPTSLVPTKSEESKVTPASELVGVNRNTGAYYFMRLREIIALKLEAESSVIFGGEIEVDESYFGAKRVRGKRGRGAAGKTPVFGLLKRGGNVHVSIVELPSRKRTVHPHALIGPN